MEIAPVASDSVSCAGGVKEFLGGAGACSTGKSLKFSLLRSLEMHARVRHFVLFMLLAKRHYAIMVSLS